jgi:Protein of unknown function (DUF4038)/WSC domain/Putative collagen-binding domain of a collagenase
MNLRYTPLCAVLVSACSAHDPSPPSANTSQAISPTTSYVGCYTDKSVRALPHALATEGATVESCMALAKAQNLAYAGLQYGGQCFGGDTLGYELVATSSCKMPCSADTKEVCGGPWLNSVYSTGVAPTANYVGCYTDSSTRALPHELASSGATVESCIALAKAEELAYAGLQDGGQCFGGDVLGHELVATSNCKMPCSADSAEICGGPWLNSIYSTGSNGSATPAWPIKASASGRYLVDANGNPFYLFSSSPWGLVAWTTPAEMATYFSDRKSYGYNAAMMNIVCDSIACGYVTHPSDSHLADGTTPFTMGTNEDSWVFCGTFTPPATCSSPRPAYWDEIDNMVKSAASAGMIAMLNPIQGAFINSADVYNPGCNARGDGLMTAAELPANGNTGMYNFGVWLGTRYSTATHPNVMWYLGNDTIGVTCTTGIHAVDTALLQNLMSGIKHADPNALISLETLTGYTYDTEFSGIAPYVQMNQVYGGPYDSFISAYKSKDIPVINGEANYTFENYANNTTGNGLTWPLLQDATNWAQNPCVANATPTAEVDPPCATMTNPAFDYIIRLQNWYQLVSGVAGTVEGNLFEDTGSYDYGACPLVHAGSCAGVASGDWMKGLHGIPDTQHKYLFNFLASIPWWTLVPNTTHTGAGALTTAGYGTYRTSAQLNALAGNSLFTEDYVASAASADHTLAVLYDPHGLAVTVNLALLSGPVTARWYDPTNGAYTAITGSPFENAGTHAFATPGNNSRGVPDWVLVLQGG